MSDAKSSSKNALQRLRELHPCATCREIPGMVVGENGVSYCGCVYGRVLRNLHKSLGDKLNDETA